MLYMDCRCNGRNIRWVVAGTPKAPYEDRTGARGCNRLGVI